MKKIVSAITLAAAVLLLAANAQAADKKYDEGASDTEVKLGRRCPIAARCRSMESRDAQKSPISAC